MNLWVVRSPSLHTKGKTKTKNTEIAPRGNAGGYFYAQKLLRSVMPPGENFYFLLTTPAFAGRQLSTT